MPTVAICGVACTARSGWSPTLDGVLAALAPFGDHEARAHRDSSAGRASVGARWIGADSPLWRSPASDDLVVVGDIRLSNPTAAASAVGRSASAAPAELVAAAYRRWGPEWPHHVDGAFAVAVVDPARATVSLFVDHGGQRPLAVWEAPEGLAFASSALALTALDVVGHALDVERAREALALMPSLRSFVRGVRMVEAGSALSIGPDGVRRWRWWDPARIAPRDRGSLDGHADGLRRHLDRAVREAVCGGTRVGVSLSGGLDSTSVAATAAAQLAPEPVHTYTAVPPPAFVRPAQMARDADESPLVLLLAERYPNLHPQFVTVEGRDLYADLEVLWELGAPPVRNAMNWLWVGAIYEEAAADGIDVLLTGGVGNAAFSADGPHVLVELLRRARVARMLQEARARAARTGRRTRDVLRTDLVDLVRPRMGVGSSTARITETRVADWVGGTALRDSQAALVDLVGALPLLADPDASRWARIGQVFAWAPMYAPVHAAVRAWHGFDVRDPTADRGLLEEALAQPEWWRRHDGVTRAVARRAMADRLPPAIVDRTVRGAQLPDWLDRLTESRAVVEAELEAARDHPASRELIDVERLTGFVRSWPTAEDSARRAVKRSHRLALARALLVSRYLRWFEQRARRVGTGGPAVVLPVR